MPKRHKPIGMTEVILQNMYEETPLQKIENSNVFRSGCVSLKIYCAKILALKINVARTTM